MSHKYAQYWSGIDHAQDFEEEEEMSKESDKEMIGESGRQTTRENTSVKTREAPSHKVNISEFIDDNWEGWVLQAERNFMFYHSSEEEKEEIAFYSMNR